MTPTPTLPRELHDTFSDIESKADLQLHDAVITLKRFVAGHSELSPAAQSAAERERFVLDLYPDPEGEHHYWGTYFRASVFIKEGDQLRSSHDPAFVTPQVLDYWRARVAEAAHPMLRARYADAAWDLAALAEGRPRDVRDARNAVDAYVQYARRSASMFPVVKELQRALNLALGIRDEARAKQVVEALFDLHRRTSSTGLAGTCFRLFDVLYPLRKKLKLASEQVKEIIDGIEAYLAAWEKRDGTGSSPHSVLGAAERLVQHYRVTGSTEDVQRVARAAGAATERMCHKAPAMVASAWLQLAYDLYQRTELKPDAERVLMAIKEKTRLSKAQMVSHVVSDTISADDMRQFVERLTAGGVDAALSAIAREFIPKLGVLRERVKKMGEQYVGMSLFPITLIDDDQPVASIGAIKDDAEGHVIHQMSDDMRFVSVFLAHVLEHFFVRYELAPEDFVDLLYQSPLFEIDRYQLLKNGVRHYREGDHISAVHVLVPQVEHALRVLLARLQRPTNMHNVKLGAYQEKDLGGILADPEVQNLLGEDADKYLRTLLTDQRGWNLRNRVSHGLYGSVAFARPLADRLVHVLMLLSLLRSEEREPEADQPPAPPDPPVA